MLQLTNVSLHFGSRTLFENINITIQARDRIGLVGRNGAGKSTLLKLINGDISSDGGSINKPQNFSIGFLTQEIRQQQSDTVWDEAQIAFKTINAIQEKVDQIQKELEERTDYTSDEYLDLSQQYVDLLDHLSHIDADDKDKQTELVLKGLGYQRSDFDKAPSTFSGGWAMRLELAKILLLQPDLILLDEPTNHLDIDSILWLEGFLQNYQGAIMMVSHDKSFLDNITNKTIEIELGKMYEYKANYSKYLEMRVERRAQQMATYKNQQDQIKQIERNIERFRAKASKATFAQSLIKKLDKMDLVEIDEVDTKSMRFDFPIGHQGGKVVVKTEHLAKSYGNKQVLSDVNLEIERGQKVAFIGKNGMGKTTMARMIVGEIEKSGGVLELGYNIEIGFFAQHHAEALPKNLTVFESVDQLAEGDVRLQVRNILGAFMFSGEDVDKKVSVLSGGERARICLSQLLLQPSNTLILDEPTNHLDIRSKDVLKESIKRYPGTVIIVSHDRDFLIGLTDKVFEFTDGTVKEYFGDIEHFFEERKLADFRALEADKAKVTNKQHENTVEQQKQNDKQDKQLKNSINKIETAIEKEENIIKTIEEKLVASYDEKLANDLIQAKDKLTTLMKEWEDLVS